MSRRSHRANADASASNVEVRSYDGEFVRRTHLAAAQDIVFRRLGEWAEFGRYRYVRLARSVPPQSGGWRGGNCTTQRIRNDAGKLIASDLHLEHRPLPREVEH